MWRRDAIDAISRHVIDAPFTRVAPRRRRRDTTRLATQALDGPRATTAAHEAPAQNYVKALLGAPGAPAEVRGRQVEQAPHSSKNAADARTSQAPASDAALRTEET